MKFYLGTHMPSWLASVDVPLFVSHRRLAKRRTFPRAIQPWALDSGGFTELSTYGEWRTTPEEYVAAISRYDDEIGNIDWCAPQDWMCEPGMLAKTGLSLEEHQKRTIDNYKTLCDLQPARPVIPVLQGWDVADYLRHIDAYDRAGIDLFGQPTVGVGTVCRRQHTAEAAELLWVLAEIGVPVHGFGLKMTAVTATGGVLTSCDSMAWSYNARRHDPLPGCTHSSCSNCPVWALRWRTRLLATAGQGVYAPRLF